MRILDIFVKSEGFLSSSRRIFSIEQSRGFPVHYSAALAFPFKAKSQASEGLKDFFEERWLEYFSLK